MPPEPPSAVRSCPHCDLSLHPLRPRTPTSSPQRGIWSKSTVGTGAKPALTGSPSEVERVPVQEAGVTLRIDVALPGWPGGSDVGFPRGGGVGAAGVRLPAGSSCWLPHPRHPRASVLGGACAQLGDGDASCEPARCPSSRCLIGFHDDGTAGAAPPPSRAARGGQGQEAVAAGPEPRAGGPGCSPEPETVPRGPVSSAGPGVCYSLSLPPSRGALSLLGDERRHPVLVQPYTRGSWRS